MDEEERRVFALESAAAALHDVGLIDDAKAVSSKPRLSTILSRSSHARHAARSLACQELSQ